MDTDKIAVDLKKSFRQYAHYALALAELQNIILQMMIEGKQSIELEELDKLITKLKTDEECIKNNK